MAIQYSDVLRVEGVEATLVSTTLRNKQVGFGTDGQHRQVRKNAAGTPDYWTADGYDVTYGNVTIGQFLYHDGDPNTYLRFGTDAFELMAGGVKYVYNESGMVKMPSEVLIGTSVYPYTGGQVGEIPYVKSSGVLGWTGVGGGAGGPVDASDVTYVNSGHPTFDHVDDALDYLLHTGIDVAGLTFTPTSQQKGQTLSTLQVDWTVNHNGTSQSITTIGAEGGSLAVALRTFTYSALSKTTDFTVTVAATDAYGSDSAVGSMLFMLYKYFGQSASATPNETIIEAALAGGSTLSADVAGSRAKVSYSQAGGGNYMYYAYPASWGSVAVYVNGFLSVWNETTVSVTNGYSNTENYKVYTSPTTIAGTLTLSFTAV